MKKLLNTLYITSPESYLSLDGENIVVKQNNIEVGRVPLHNLDGIVTMGYVGASPALMGACAERNIGLVFLTASGKYLARIVGKTKGNIVLRKRQFQVAEMKEKSLAISKNIILSKVYNSRWVIERLKRDHGLQVDVEKLQKCSNALKKMTQSILMVEDVEELRGIEGAAASVYFSSFDDMILQQKKAFSFQKRNRRPPLDNVNALLSFSYTLLTSMVTNALETVGLDPAIGFMHGERPGRNSLALDLMEELRPVMADRFVLTLINRKIIQGDDFVIQENGAVLLKDDARKIVLSEWQKRKQVEIKHPYLEEKVQWGVVPYVQAMLLSRHLRGDIENYPPFFWK